MLAFSASRSSNVLSSVILPSSLRGSINAAKRACQCRVKDRARNATRCHTHLRIALCASCTTAYSRFSTPYDARLGSTTCAAPRQRPTLVSSRLCAHVGAAARCGTRTLARALTYSTPSMVMDTAHVSAQDARVAVRAERDAADASTSALRTVVARDGLLRFDGDRLLLQAPRVAHAVHLQTPENA